MKKFLKGFVLALLLLTLPGAAFGVEFELSADATAVSVGDEVLVTILARGENIAAAEGAFNYDPALLSYVSGAGGASDGYISLLSMEKGGAEYLTATVRFTAIANGEAVISASLTSAYDYEGNSLDTAGLETAVNISVSGDETGAPASPAPGEDYSATGVAAENVEGASEPMYVWRSLQSLTLPSGYADRQVQYRGEFVGGAAIPDTDMPILLYLSSASGDMAGYYVYDAARNLLYPYNTVSSVLASYTFIRPDDTVSIPAGYGETTLQLSEDSTVPAWKQAGMEAEVYLIYARNSGGEVGFFLYNKADRSVQRYVEAAALGEAAPQETPRPAAGSITLKRPIFYLMLVLGAALLLAVVGILIMHFSTKRKLEDRYRRRLRKLKNTMRGEGSMDNRG